MTRKRFVKLLMSRRWTRDEANEIAKNVYAYGRRRNYSRYYRGIAARMQNRRFNHGTEKE